MPHIWRESLFASQTLRLIMRDYVVGTFYQYISDDDAFLIEVFGASQMRAAITLHANQ
jgi:hypothetical protein